MALKNLWRDYKTTILGGKRFVAIEPVHGEERGDED